MKTKKDELTPDSGGSGGGLPRRDALKAIALLAAAPLAGQKDGAAQSASARPAASVENRREQSFDEGWRFFRGDAPGAEFPDFNDSAWRALDLPHDFSVEDLPPALPTQTARELYGEPACFPLGSDRSTQNSVRAGVTPGGSWAARAGIASAFRRPPCLPAARSKLSSMACT